MLLIGADWSGAGAAGLRCCCDCASGARGRSNAKIPTLTMQFRQLISISVEVQRAHHRVKSKKLTTEGRKHGGYVITVAFRLSHDELQFCGCCTKTLLV